jgi:hypothetical protein
MLLFTHARKFFRVRVKRIAREQLDLGRNEGGKEEVIGGWRQLHTHLCILYTTPKTWMVGLNTMCWPGHATRHTHNASMGGRFHSRTGHEDPEGE